MLLMPLFVFENRSLDCLQYFQIFEFIVVVSVDYDEERKRKRSKKMGLKPEKSSHKSCEKCSKSENSIRTTSNCCAATVTSRRFLYEFNTIDYDWPSRDERALANVYFSYVNLFVSNVDKCWMRAVTKYHCWVFNLTKRNETKSKSHTTEKKITIITRKRRSLNHRFVLVFVRAQVKVKLLKLVNFDYYLWYANEWSQYMQYAFVDAFSTHYWIRFDRLIFCSLRYIRIH